MQVLSNKEGENLSEIINYFRIRTEAAAQKARGQAFAVTQSPVMHWWAAGTEDPKAIYSNIMLPFKLKRLFLAKQQHQSLHPE